LREHGEICERRWGNEEKDLTQRSQRTQRAQKRKRQNRITDEARESEERVNG
jgi:hypothetical protein